MNKPSSPSGYVRIFDTTLRDGEQSPGATLTSAEKLSVAHALSRLGVDVIEAGFPAASPDDLEAVRTIASTIGAEPVEGRPSSEPPIICGLARATRGDIDKAWEAVRPARHPRIHTFIATSPIHREHKLRMSKEQILARVNEMVGYARSLCEDIEFSAEDAGRTEPEFLQEVVQAAVKAGATTLNIPDTVGYTMPDEFGELVGGVVRLFASRPDIVVSVHCHNDLGLASANALAGIRAGARQAEVTINGIGERAGNSALEEVAMALHTRRALLGLRTGIDTTQLCRVSKLVCTSTGVLVQPNKAVVGANAFAHESGIHQDGMLKHQTTYEIMRPETVGAKQTRLVLGKHSGRHAFAVRLRELGHPMEGATLQRAFERFKALADRKKHLTDADLDAIASSEIERSEDAWTLDDLHVLTGTSGMPTATVRLRSPTGATVAQAAVGSGPIDAVFKAIDQIVKAPTELVDYSVHAVTEGMDALGESSVRIRAASTPPVAPGEEQKSPVPIFHGHGVDTDVIVASTKAYLAAVNRLVSAIGSCREKMPSDPTGVQTNGPSRADVRAVD